MVDARAAVGRRRQCARARAGWQKKSHWGGATIARPSAGSQGLVLGGKPRVAREWGDGSKKPRAARGANKMQVRAAF